MIQKDLCKMEFMVFFYMRYRKAEKNIFSAFLFHQMVLTFIFLVCYYLCSYKIIETKLFLKDCDSNGLFPSSMTELYFKLISVVLVLTMVFSLSATAFAADFDFHPDESITIIDEADSSFGKVYYINPSGLIQSRTLWDVADVVMSGVNWAEFLVNHLLKT